jgi:predicted  nucleic acid-binding Zn-ribbon protein
MEGEDSSQKIDKRRLKSFVRHLCFIAKKHKDKEEAKGELEKQIKKIKQFTSKKKGIDKELKELNRKIALVLEKEMQLLGSSATKTLKSNVTHNNEEIKKMSDSMNSLKLKMENYMDFKTKRDRKIINLEKKIRDKADSKKSYDALKNQIKKTETQYRLLAKKGIQAHKIEQKINDLRIRLSFS